MAELTLTIPESHPKFGSILALLNGSTAGAGVSHHVTHNAIMPPPLPSTSDDDDAGPVNTAAPALDATGLPWDERIHAATKNTNADGSWKSKRGGPKGEALAAIEAELRARQAATPAVAPPLPTAGIAPPPPPVMAPAPVPPIAPPAGVMPPPPPPVAPMTAPVAAPPPPPVAPVASPEPTTLADFPAFMAHLQTLLTRTNAEGAPLVDQSYLAGLAAEIATNAGITTNAITDLAQPTHAHLVQYAAQLMQRDGRW
jgi:hypothetical protein